jgi:hypothetical protein
VKRSEQRWRVSVWVGFEKGDPDVDVLKELCGVKSYDLDYQEIIIDDEKWKEQSIHSLLRQLSYSSSFLTDALLAAKKRGIAKALYVLAQYRFVYDPKKARKKIAADPIFLGSFTWRDDESAQRMRQYFAAMDSEEGE